MSRKLAGRVVALTLGLALGGCGKKAENGGDSEAARADVVKNYALMLQKSYGDVVDKVKLLHEAVLVLAASPSEAALATSRQTWLDARMVYGQTEAYRFYDGPIDNTATGPEARINSWPLDEAYIDYVVGRDDAGIINTTSVEISKENLSLLNAGSAGDVLDMGDAFEAEKAISIGFHAIEFLLWGQDQSESGPGDRPWQDYLTTAEATHPSGARRGLYLASTTELLVEDLTSVAMAWASDDTGYRQQFVTGNPDDGLRKMLTGVGILSKGELAGERIDVALDTLDQEDEHSCFSDNTHVDIRMNARGLANVYYGRYGDLDGPGIDELLADADPDLAVQVAQAIDNAVAAAENIPAPFDQAISNKDSSGWQAANATVLKLYEVGDQVVRVGQALQLGNISVDLPK